MESPGFMFDGAVLDDERPISGASLPPVRPVSVSYTHLTLPTILLV